MRKRMRMLVLALMLLVVPAVNAHEEIQCVPGLYIYYPVIGWQCTFWEEGQHCLLCSYTITVMG